MDQANLFTRRNNSGKPPLSMRDSDSKDGSRTDSPRTLSNRRFGETPSNGKSNPFSALSPSAAKSPSAGASSAFNLGKGVFASFGQVQTPKTPSQNSGFDFPLKDKEKSRPEKEREAEAADKAETEAESEGLSTVGNQPEHPLKATWNFFYRPPVTKFSDYEKSIVKIASVSTVEEFWTIYLHLNRPSLLPTVSDYHIFKDGIRPVWEDDANKRGGKWIIRLKKGVADRYWEDLLLVIIGDQFAEAGDEVCGAVLSVRNGEDVMSVWTKNDGGRNIKIRETIKRLLAFPSDTNIVWKSHDESIAQRSAADEVRLQKSSGVPNVEKRRSGLHAEDTKTKHAS